jgi:co-chaperonin GroES (HSP10)
MILSEKITVASKKGEKIEVNLYEDNGSWTPAPGYLLVMLVDTKKEEGSIILPESQQESQNQGIVLAMTHEEDKNKEHKSFCKVGDIVSYSKFSPKELKINDKKFYFVASKDVHGIWSKKIKA